MNTNMELMKKLIEEKKAKGKKKQNLRAEKFGNQSNGSGKISNGSYGK